MRIGKERKPCEVKFVALNRGDAFYWQSEHSGEKELYVKIPLVEYDRNQWDTVKHNAVRLEDGALEFVENEDTVTIANVHIEDD